MSIGFCVGGQLLELFSRFKLGAGIVIFPLTKEGVGQIIRRRSAIGVIFRCLTKEFAVIFLGLLVVFLFVVSISKPEGCLAPDVRVLLLELIGLREQVYGLGGISALERP